MRATLCIDDAVGEMRRCLLDEDGLPVRIDLERWSERETRIRADDLWWGRIGRRMAGGRSWFVDLGAGRSGVIKAREGDGITEGLMLPLIVVGEPRPDKGATLVRDVAAPTPAPPDRPQRRGAAADPFLSGVEIAGTLEGRSAREAVDAAVEEASAATVPLAGGGDLAIEPTRALTSIDVDAGGRQLNAKGFADLNHAAAEAIARQLALRSIGGLVVVDFVSTKSRREGDELAGRLRSALKRRGVANAQVAPLSQFGLCEMALEHRRRPLAAALGADELARRGLDALRGIESEGWAEPGRRIICTAPADVATWLAGPGAELSAELSRRIGGRWTVEATLDESAPVRTRSVR